MKQFEWRAITQYLQEVNVVSITFRILLAMFIGGILGFERERKNRPAGFRTYILVCIGATLVMITNQYMYEHFEAVVDPGRLGAQVISGIGFLGAGTIIVTRRSQIKGLTTAAGLWAAACLGLAIGIGFYAGAVIGGLAIMIAMFLLYKVDRRIKANGRYINVYIEFGSISYISSFMSMLQENGMEILDMTINKGQIPGNENIAIVLSIKTASKMLHSTIIQLLSQASGIQYIEEI